MARLIKERATPAWREHYSTEKNQHHGLKSTAKITDDLVTALHTGGGVTVMVKDLVMCCPQGHTFSDF